MTKKIQKRCLTILRHSDNNSKINLSTISYHLFFLSFIDNKSFSTFKLMYFNITNAYIIHFLYICKYDNLFILHIWI